MAGCYGNDQEDRYFEKMLDKHLDEQEKYFDDEEETFCDECGEETENCIC